MRRDGVRRLRASSQRGTRAASELPPGPLGVPARSWLTDRSAHSSATDRTKAGPGAGKRRDWRAARRPRMPRGTSHKDLRFSARHPPFTPRTREASRQGARMPAVTTGASSFETARSAPPRMRKNAAHVASSPHPEEGRKARLEGRGPSDATNSAGMTRPASSPPPLPRTALRTIFRTPRGHPCSD